jgi:hypothetical protein
MLKELTAGTWNFSSAELALIEFSSLHAPVRLRTHCSQFPLVNRLFPGRVGREKQQLLLNRRAEQVEIEDLRHSRLGYVAEPGELSDASHLAAIKHALILDR